MKNHTLLEDKKSLMEMENNMREKLKYVASKLHNMRTENIKGVSVVDTALSSDTFNTAFGGQIEDHIAQEVFLYYKKTNQPMAWWIGPSSTSEHTEKCLEKAGFVLNELDIGMVCHLAQIIESQSPEKLTIRQCVTPEDYDDFGEVLASIFDPPDEQVKVFYKKMATLSSEETKDMLLFVGYEEKHPVATSCLFITNVAGIYDIATRPEKRNLGYGSAMFYHTLIESQKRGLHKSVLQASPDGLNIYKRFGFEEVCHFVVWSNRITPLVTLDSFK